MICPGCNTDRPAHHMRTLAFLHAGWPPVELAALCRTCRRALGRGAVLRRALACLLYLTLFAAVAGLGYCVVRLVLWILRRVSTS